MGLISLHASPPSPPPDPPAVSRGWFLLSQTLTLLLIVWLKSSQTLHDPPLPLIQCRGPPPQRWPAHSLSSPYTTSSSKYIPGTSLAVQWLRHCPVKKKSASFCPHLCMRFFTAFRLVMC